jgi:hypothetical protein
MEKQIESLVKMPITQVMATLEILQNAGITPNGLKNLRRNPERAKEIRKILKQHETRTSRSYPDEYKVGSIKRQVEALLKVPEWKNLDAAWALNEAQSWYDSLNLPAWVESPLVYVRHEAVGGYHNGLDKALSFIDSSRTFYNYRNGQMTSDRLRQLERTSDMESDLKKQQQGDFRIVPSQAGIRWGGYSVSEARDSVDSEEFLLGAFAEACRAISTPNRYVRWEQLHTDCGGDEFDDPDSDSRWDRAPIFEFYDGEVRFAARHVGDVSVNYGSASGFLSQ